MEEILVGDAARTPPRFVASASAVAGRGLVGDRYYSRMGTWSDYPDQTGVHLTLIEGEVLEAVGLTGAEARRNVVTRGIRLNELVGRRFSIGPIVCAGIRLCEPCTYLSQLTRIPVDALVHRGGLRADILSGGEIAVGDLVVVI
ncbi:MAG TPA: MOSC domain-containing protein [Gaiellaceae bacterium]